MGPAGQVRDQRGSVRGGGEIGLGRGGEIFDGEERERREDGDHRDVLKKEDSERGLAGGSFQLSAFLERGEDDGGGGHRDDEAGREGDAEFEAEGGAETGDGGGGEDDLKTAETDELRAHAPEEEGWSSRPTMKSIMTTPTSTKCMTSPPCWPTRPSTWGPIRMPAMR